MTTTLLQGPAGALAVDDGGPAERGDLPVLFVHSLAGSSAHWKSQLEHLRKSRRAVALDLRGHGRSQAPKNHDYSMAGMAGDVEAVVDALALMSFVLVGHSMGGGVALTSAGIHPARVRALLLVDPIGDGKQMPADEVRPFLAGLESNYDRTIQEYWTGIAGPNPSIRERLLDDLRATPRETVVQVLHEVMRFDPDPALARYRGPIHSIVTPSNDAPFSLHRLGQGFRYKVITGTGHWIQLDKPDEFNQIMDEFLNKPAHGSRLS